jgi:hypothetical protein
MQMVRAWCLSKVESASIGLQLGEVPEQVVAEPHLASSANEGESALEEDPEPLLPAS